MNETILNPETKEKPRIAVVMPCFGDSASATRTIEELSSAYTPNVEIEVFVVNDQPFEPLAITPDRSTPESGPKGLDVFCIELTHNVGQQKAIAIGACYVAQFDYTHILLMDCDGEDNPEEAARMIRERSNKYTIVASRGKRNESKRFNAGYKAYKLLFSLFTGIEIDFGNFMILPIRHARELLSRETSWVHIAATLLRSGLPIKRVVIDRGARYHGQSKMNFSKLIFLGLTATSIFSEMIVGRLFGLCQTLWVAFAIAVIYLFIKKIFYTSPLGWATLISLQLLTLSTVSTLILLTFCCLLVWQKSQEYESIQLNFNTFIRHVHSTTSAQSTCSREGIA